MLFSAQSTFKVKPEFTDDYVQGKADATWVFLGHEGVQAQMDGIKLNIFKLADYGIPYGFTPTLIAIPETLRSALHPPCALSL